MYIQSFDCFNCFRGRPFDSWGEGGGLWLFCEKKDCSANFGKEIVCSATCGKKIVCS